MGDEHARRERQSIRADLKARMAEDGRLAPGVFRDTLETFSPPGLLGHRTFEDHEIFFDPRDDKIGLHLLQGREWQRRYIDRAVASLQAEGLLRVGSVYLDVGANIGCTVIYAMRSGVFSRALALEPEPHNAAILRRNIGVNGLSETVDVIGVAAGAEVARLPLRIDPKNFGKHTLAAPHLERGRAGRSQSEASNAIEVDVVPLDDLVAASNFDLDQLGLIKIDTEGHERDVLAGASEMMAHSPPLIIEVSGFQSRPDAAAEVMRCLARAHKTCIRLDREPWVAVALPTAEFQAEADQHELLVFGPSI